MSENEEIDRAGYPEFDDYPDLEDVKKVLVVILKNIGDVLLTSPVFAALKEAMPWAEIDAYVNSGTEAMLAHNPNVGSVVILNREALKGGFSLKRAGEELRLLKILRGGGYTLVVLLSTGSRPANAALLTGAPVRVGPELKKGELFGKYAALTHVAPMVASGRHYVERHLDCLRRIGIFPAQAKRATEFFEGEAAAESARAQLTDRGIDVEAGERYIVVHPTSRWMFKCWTTEKVAELVDKVQSTGTKVVLTSGPDSKEQEYMEAVMDALETLETNVISFRGSLSLLELGAVIHGAVLFFGVDSAPMHMAAAVKTPVVALFGPTFETDWAPWPSSGDGPTSSDEHTVITLDSYDCRPCGQDGCDGTKISDCVTEIEVETVFDAIVRKLGISL
ncbi:MAG: putative lipopolysaccharide heptosyltransferase III [Proteobacteria bacterium]|nr:putative lipopolysaccharide heptosyltransferase III [Pseudomonadota bacterium]